MDTGVTDRADLLLVVSDEALYLRVAPVLATWRLHALRCTLHECLQRVEAAECRVAVVEKREGVKLQVERLRAAGAVVVVLGLREQEGLQDVDFAVRPSELVAAIHRAQGRLAGVESGGLDRVNRFAQAIATQFTLPDLTHVAIARTRELCEAEGASLLLVDGATGELCFDAVDGSAAGSLQRVRLQRGVGVAGKVAVEGRPRLVVSAWDSPDFDRSTDLRTGFHTGSIVAAPLVLGGDVLGVLMAVRSRGLPPFSPMHLERLVQLAPHVAIAVHNVQITTALRASQTEVLEANASLEAKVRERTAQISRAKQEWERTFDAIDEPIALIDGYTLRRTNSAYARRVGQRVSELPGRLCHRVFAGRESPCPECPLDKARGTSLVGEIQVADPIQARPATFRFSGYWMSDEPESRVVVVTYQDITHARHLQERLRESERLAAVGQLASGAAHEINNPLGFVASNLRTLRGLVDELRSPMRVLTDAMAAAREGRIQDLQELLSRLEGPDLQVLDDGLEMIDESLDGARRVGDIVKGLRELSRLEIGKREPANVNASISRAVRAEFGEAPANLDLQLQATRSADIPPLQLDQVLGHVLRNARQAVGKHQRIHVRTFDSGHEVRVEVRDEGIGISQDHLRRVFEPFFTTRGVGKGIGLGLTAAYGIVRRSGGDIEAESGGPGKGATFTVKLPLAEEQPSSSELGRVA
jgi:signal transduction histidine kinase/GAF domain-containing protein